MDKAIKEHKIKKKVSEYFKKYPRVTTADTAPDPSTVELLEKLNAEVEFLQRVLKNNPK